MCEEDRVEQLKLRQAEDESISDTSPSAKILIEERKLQAWHLQFILPPSLPANL